MLPINKVENSRRMLASGHYQTKKYRNEEDLWLIRYLKDKKYSKEQIYKKWLEIYPSRGESAELDENPSRLFNNLYNHVGGVKLDVNQHQVCFSEPEIAFIEALVAPKWIKEYVFALVACSRASGTFVYDSLPLKDILPALSRKNKSPDQTKQRLMDFLFSNGLMSKIEIKEHYDMLPTFDKDGFENGLEFDVDIVNTRYKVVFPDLDGQIAFSSASILDVFDEFDRFTDFVICPRCGERFLFSSKTQRNVCPECWRKKRVQDSSVCRKKRMLTPK